METSEQVGMVRVSFHYRRVPYRLSYDRTPRCHFHYDEQGYYWDLNCCFALCSDDSCQNLPLDQYAVVLAFLPLVVGRCLAVYEAVVALWQWM